MTNTDLTAAEIAEALALFGWNDTDEFWHRYHTDRWVFSLANALVSVLREKASQK